MSTAIQVDFFVIDTASAQVAWRFACEWVEKTYTANATRIYLHTETRADAEKLDTLLWTYRDNSFVPHQIYQPSQNLLTDILIGYPENVPDYTAQDEVTLVNLSSHLPASYSNYKQLVEIVFTDPTMQQLARERFKQYRQHGYQLNTHKMNPS